MRQLATMFALALAACSASTPALSPSPLPSGGIGGVPRQPTTWAFAGTLFLPPDPNVYSDVVLDAKPLSGGGWVVIHAASVRQRPLCDPTTFGCGFGFRSLGALQRLDASGHVVAQEHGAEPFGLTDVAVFERDGVVVGEGPQVRNGTLHAFRLDSLDGIASELSNCIAIDDRCFSYRVDYQAGIGQIAERAINDLHVTRTDGSVDAPSGDPALFPASNLLVWRRTAETAPFIRAVALDPARPIAIPWLTKLQGACGIVRVADDRAAVTYGPATCHGDNGWHTDLVEVSTGRIVRALAAGDSVSGNASAGRSPQLVLSESGVAIDPRDGSAGP